MSFTVVDFLRLVLTTTLWRIESTIRNRLFIRLTKYDSFKGMTPAIIEKNYYLDKFASFITATSYRYLEVYDDIPEIQDEVLSGTGRNQDDFKQIARMEHTRCAIIAIYPHVPSHLKLTLSVNKILRQRIAQGPDPATASLVIAQLMLCLLDYTEDLKIYLSTSPDDLPDYNLFLTATKGALYNGTDPTFGTDFPIDTNDLINELQSQSYLLADPSVDDEVFKFIACPGFGSFAVSYSGDTKFPLYATFMTLNMTASAALFLIKARYSSQLDFTSDDEDALKILSNIDDKTIQVYESIALNSSQGSQILEHRERILAQARKSSGAHDDDDGNFGHFGMSGAEGPGSSRGSRNRGRGRGNQNQGPRRPPNAPPPPSIPDDSKYEPAISNTMLFVLSKDWTKLAKKSTDRIHDHMDRFGSTNEQPQPLGKYEVRKGQNADWQIFSHESDGTKEYVVTFTRKSRKPIFNPVI